MAQPGFEWTKTYFLFKLLLPRKKASDCLAAQGEKHIHIYIAGLYMREENNWIWIFLLQ